MDYEELVRALYANLLGRAPDEEGARNKVGRLDRGEVGFDALIKEFVESEEYRDSVLKGGKLFRDQTQFGEFELLLKRMCDKACSSKVVVDVGARGKARSNAYDLMNTFGWRGVLIEANPRLQPEIARDFGGLDLTLVECAVSDFEGQADFHIGVNDDVSSLSQESAGAWGATAGKVSVTVRRLASILVEHGVPETFGFLSVDLEGEDIRVLNDLIATSPFRPQWIIVEASHDFATTSLSQLPVVAELLSEYELVGQTRANLILERVV